MLQKMVLKAAVLLLICLRFLYVFSDDLEVGSACIMKDGTQGICLKQSDCPFITEDTIETPTYCENTLWNPIICCLDCQVIESRFFDGLSMSMSLDFAFEIKLTDSGKNKHRRCLEALNLHFPCNKYEEFKDLDNSIQCFEIPYDNQALAVRGNNDKKNDNHHLALLGHGVEPDHAIWTCSGSIISDKYILTAAHCTSSSALGITKFAALGVLKHLDQQKYWQIYDVVKVINHPQYKPPSKYDDIALLETGTKIKYNHEVIPACLHRGFETGMFATATGWGAMEQPNENPLAAILRSVVLKKSSVAECMQAYPKHRHLVHGYNRMAQVCYGDGDQFDDFCEGDSGGPLQFKSNMKNSKCLYTIIGVTSYGRACGHFGSSALYTRVDFYVPWIESITGNLS